MANAWDPSPAAVTIEDALKIADRALGYPNARPKSLEVVVAKFFQSKDQDLALEGASGDTQAQLLKLQGKRYWLVMYRKTPIRLDGSAAVFVDADTGAILIVSKDR